MKKFLSSLIILILITLTLNNAVSTLDAAGNNMHYSYIKSCDLGTVSLEESDLLGFPTEIIVKGWNCNGPSSEGSEYTVQIWDHFFWLL